jgi:beta-xylosidase
MRKELAILCLTATWAVLSGSTTPSAHAWQSDNGDGTFKNPVLYADYADPDIIRVSNDFYMVSTTFVDSPGVTVLHSRDMVNWEIASHCATNLDGGNTYNLIGGAAYQAGFWASSIRYYNGTFYVLANPTFANSRLYYATNAAGPWQYYQLNQVVYDAGLFFETNGTGYIVFGYSPRQSVATLNANYSQILSVSNNVVNSGGEGSHVVKRGAYYYLFNANPGVWPFQLRCARATNIFGPWETGHICLTATTGGHQGAIVDINNSDQWFGFVHQDSGSIGRMPRIGPVFWENNWPVFGTTSARDQMAASYTKPVAGQPLLQPATSDEFTNATLGLQWQWNHNPDNTRWSLTQRPGYLRLRPTCATNFWFARNTLTQKGQGPVSCGIVKLDLSNLQAGDVAGFGTLGKVSAHIAVSVGAGGSKKLATRMIKDTVGTYSWDTGVTISGNTLYLRTDLNFTNNLGVCSYSTDGATWTKLGGNFELLWGYGSTFQGEKFAVFCYNTNTAASTGFVDVDSFTFGGSAPQVTLQRGRPKLNAARTTFVADNGQPLRGPYTSSEWTSGSDDANIASMRSLGLNALHLYAESFDPNYPNTGSTAPGYSVANVDRIVAATRAAGLYLVITIGNGAYNGNHNLAWATNFWNFYAPRYANETHVIYEIHNEPLAWGPSYLTGTTPTNTMALEINAYNAIRASAPNTPVLLFTYAVFGGTGGTSAALTDIHAFNSAVFGNANAVWTNEAVGFHGYAGWSETATAVAGLINAGYPCFMTEFGGVPWGSGTGGLSAELTSELERLGVSWLTFQYVPPYGVSDNVSEPVRYSDIVENAGLSWTPDFGSWPPARSPYGNGGQPRLTPTNWVNDFLTGTLRLQAEDFDAGGEGEAYHDTDSANNGGQYRTSEGVDLYTCNDTSGGYKVGSTATGEWIEYTLWVWNPGYYNLSLRYATPNSDCAARIICNAKDKTGTWSLAASGAYTTWLTATRQVFLDAGRQKLRLEIASGGFDLNWIEFAPATTGPIANGTYKFLNAANGLALTGVLTPTNNFVRPDSYTGSTLQQWNVQHLGAGQYKITSVRNSWSWTSFGGHLGFVWWWGIGGDQCYVIKPTGGGYYSVLTVGGGSALTTTATPTNIDQNAYSGAANQQWAIIAPSAPSFPSGLSAAAVSWNQISLTWNAVAGATSYNVKRATTSGGPYNTIASGVTATNYTDTVDMSVKYFYVVSAVSGGVESLNSQEAGVNLPYPWQSQDIGSVGVAGGASYSNGVFTAVGSGADIWDTADGFRFTYLPASGNCTVIARVVSLENVNSWSKAGVMIRETLDANSRHAFVAVTPGNGVAWQYRSTTGGNSSNTGAGGLSAPYWVKLVRSGDTFTASRSADGVTWVQMGSTTISMATGVYVGLAISSHNNSTLAAAVFDNVSVPNWPAPAAPTGLIVTGVSSNQISLAWNAFPGATSYYVKRSVTNGGPYSVVAGGVTATNYSDAGLVGGTIYYYVVSALAGGSVSSNSLQVAAATVLPSFGSLVHRYSFLESGGNTVADSVGGPAWAGTLPNSGGLSDGLLTFASSSQQYVSLPGGIVSSLSNMTIMTWFNLSSVSSWSRIWDFGNNSTTNMFLTPQCGGSSTLRFAITTNGGGAEQQINCSATISTGVWHQVVVTLSGRTGILYLDGVAVGTNANITINPKALGVTTQNYIGKSQYPDPCLDGAFDELRIYNVALSPAEIAATAVLGSGQLLTMDSPFMAITNSGTNITLSWPLASAGSILQSRTNLLIGSWVNVASPSPQINGRQWQVTVPVSSQANSIFYRLAK